MVKSRAGFNPLSKFTQNESIDNTDNANIKMIKLKDIKINPNQPRKTFTTNEMEELKASIKKDGLIQSVAVTPIENSEQYLLVAGERRVRACGDLGIVTIPAMLTKGDPLEIALIENVQRQNLTPFEESEAYNKLIKEKSLTPLQIAEVIGKDRTVVVKIVKIHSIPDEIKKECLSSNINQKETLFAISNMKTEQEMKNLIANIKQNNLTTKQVRNFIKKEKKTETQKQKAQPQIQPQTKSLSNDVSSLILSLNKVTELSNEEKKQLCLLYKKIGEFGGLELA